MRPELSLIIPLYNENDRLRKGLITLNQFAKHIPYTWELLLIDDGSRIVTSDIVSEMKQSTKNLPLTLYRLSQNKGKGAAIAEGMKRAKGKYIVFCDIDFSVPPEAIIEIVQALETVDIAIASRRLASSTIVLHQPFLREFSGRIFTFLSNTLFTLHLADATCGCKGFKAEVGKDLFRRMRVMRWVFDTEILFLARKKGYSIAEVPVSWSHSKETRVKPWDMVQSLFDLLRIKWYWLTGMY